MLIVLRWSIGSRCRTQVASNARRRNPSDNRAQPNLTYRCMPRIHWCPAGRSSPGLSSLANRVQTGREHLLCACRRLATGFGFSIWAVHPRGTAVGMARRCTAAVPRRKSVSWGFDCIPAVTSLVRDRILVCWSLGTCSWLCGGPRSSAWIGSTPMVASPHSKSIQAPRGDLCGCDSRNDRGSHRPRLRHTALVRSCGRATLRRIGHCSCTRALRHAELHKSTVGLASILCRSASAVMDRGHPGRRRLTRRSS